MRLPGLQDNVSINTDRKSGSSLAFLTRVRNQ